MRSTSYVLAALLISFGSPTAFAADDEAIEEVVVTGSYLKRNAADSPSPLSVVTSADIEDLGAADVSEIVQAMPWQSGSQTRATTFSGEGADGRNSINLRNLGHGATLPLVNGKRHVASWYNPRGNASVNVNALVPNIAIERIEIVKDGASALYGSDAIAGVVNFITKKDFEGFDFNYQYTVDDETSKGDAHTFEVLFGVQGDRGGIVAAASMLNRDPITIGDRYDRFGGSSVSSTGQPGRITPLGGQTHVWAANGLFPGQQVGANGETSLNNFPRAADGSSFGQADVDCETAAAFDGEGGTLGPVFGNLICAYDFGSFFSMQAEESLRKFNVAGHYDLTDSLETYFEFAANDAEFDRFNSLNPNALNLVIGTNHLGNIEDAFRRGIEPIEVINRTRMLGGTVDLIGSDYRPLATFTNTTRSDQRMIMGFVWDTEIAGRSWTIDASYTATEHDSGTSQVQDTLSTHMELAMAGFGGPNCDPTDPAAVAGEGNAAYAASGGNFDAGNCYFFNPFGNSQFARDGSVQTDLTLRNAPELYEWLLGRITNDSEFRQRVIDVVASGDIIDTDYGPVGLAIGFQRRRDTGDVVFDAAANTNNLDFAFGAQDWTGSLTTTAAFVEVAVPIGDTIEINAAARYEEFDQINEESVDPKLTVLWRPTDALTLRASTGSSFRVPSLQQLFGSITTVANQTDFGGDSAFRPSISTGNPTLSPEEADTTNIGISWIPQEGVLEGLQIDLDYYSYEYSNIITRESSTTLLREDNIALQDYIDANGGTLLDAVNAGAGNRAQVVRNGVDGGLLRILPQFANANAADISGLDVTASYSFDNDLGSWRVGLQAAFVDEYEVEAGGTTFDAVGQYNDRNPVARPLPEFKLNATLNWTLNNHRAFLLIKHVDEIDYGFDLATDPGSGAARFWNATIALANGPGAAADFFTRDIDSFTTADAQYTYTFGETGFLTDSRLTLGIQNILNEEPPWAPVNTGFEATLHDPRGRIWFVRFGGSM
ncbi:MAG: TonB-dependent receptor [Pseudomonadota bacterium]